MKKIIKMSMMMALMTIVTLSFNACGSDDDDDKQPVPQITLHEANIEGNILCIQADVTAPGRVSSILLTVNDKNGVNKLVSGVTDSKYIGVLNIDGFHVHLDIEGKNIEEGDVFKMTVVDAESQSTTAEKVITAEEDEE